MLNKDTQPARNSTVNFQLSRSLLAIRMESPRSRSLVRIPTNSVVKRRAPSASERGFVEVVWRGRPYLVFGEDLSKQNLLSATPEKSNT